MGTLTPYIDFFYFLLLLYPTVPAVILGMVGRLSIGYVLLATAGMIWLQYDNPFVSPPASGPLPGAYPLPGAPVYHAVSLTLWQRLIGLQHSAPQLVFLLAYTAFELLVMLAFGAVRRRGKARWGYYLAIALALAPLTLVKFYPLYLAHRTATTGLVRQQTAAIHPANAPASGSLLVPGLVDAFGFLGISYITFRAVDVLINLQDGLITTPGIRMYLAFLLFFPTISAGPIDRIRRFSGDWKKRRTRAEYVADMDAGIYRVAQGFVYKFIIATLIWQHWLSGAGQHPGLLPQLSYMYGYSFYLFFDFAGYSAFAIGVSYFFGVHTPENFRAPFLSRNFKDFWNRWFITLSWWLRDHVYMRFVLGATRRKLFRNKYVTSYVGYLITMGLMGLWHGPQANYLVYGLYQGVMLIASDFLARWNQRRQLLPDNSLTRAASVFVTFNLACFGLLIFSGHLFV